MKRSFKLATVFTGVAALAGGYEATALAATTHAAAPDVVHQWQLCGTNTNNVSHYVHIYYPSSGHHAAECLAGPVGSPLNPLPTRATIYAYCPGNNSGALYGTTPGSPSPTSYQFFHTYPRQTMRSVGLGDPNFSLTGISIYHWAGTNTCPKSWP
jgi:hypothetical protein